MIFFQIAPSSLYYNGCIKPRHLTYLLLVEIKYCRATEEWGQICVRRPNIPREWGSNPEKGKRESQKINFSRERLKSPMYQILYK